MPTLSDLAGIPVPPLCPPDSRDIRLCTEGTSLRPILWDPKKEVKRASFSQYPHTATAGLALQEATSAVPDCPSTALGQWNGDRGDVFGIEAAGAHGDVVMNTSRCRDCGFASAAGHLTPAGVELTLRFASAEEPILMVGSLQNKTRPGTKDGMPPSPKRYVIA